MTDTTSALNLFAGLDLNEAKAAMEYFHLINVAPGQDLFHEGDAGDSLCVVNDGKISVFKAGREIAIMTKGRAFGEMSVLDGRPRSATCRGGSAACSVLTLDEKALRAMMKSQPVIAGKVLHALASSLASRLRRADQRLVEVLWGD